MSAIALVPAPVVDDPADLERGTAAAERLRAEALITDVPLELLEQAEQALRDLALLHASVLELRERVWADQFGSEARFDLGTDVYELATRVQTFALAVRA